MDRIEQTIRRKDTEKYDKDRAKYRVCCIIAGIFGIAFVFFLISTFRMLGLGMKLHIFNALPLLITAVGAIIPFVLKDNMLIEYDYIVEDDTLTVAKIKNLTSRKEVLVLHVNAMKRIEKYNPQKYSELSMSKLNCTLNGDDEKYMLFYELNGNGVLLFEPNETLLKMLQKELNR